MATVIPLVPGRGRDQATAVPTTDDDPLARAVELLQRRAGDHGEELPVGLGRTALRAEALLVHGPTAIDPSTLETSAAIVRADRIVTASDALPDLISEEAAVLGEALSADVGSLHLDTMHDVADAVLQLGMAPRAAACWGDPSAAAAAEVVLGAVAEDLRDAARAHEGLYQRYNEGIWQVPVPLLLAGRRRWRLVARARLRRLLRIACRTDRVGSVTAAANDVLDVRAARERLSTLAPLLSHHLAELDRGPLSDVDDALRALAAVRRLHASLGETVDGGRLHQLLLADAFRSDDVAGPALKLRNAIRAWRSDVEAAGGASVGHLDLDGLARWAAECAALLPVLTEGHEAAAQIGAPAPTLRALVEVLLVREHVQELTTGEAPFGGHDHAWSAS